MVESLVQVRVPFLVHRDSSITAFIIVAGSHLQEEVQWIGAKMASEPKVLAGSITRRYQKRVGWASHVPQPGIEPATQYMP